MRFWLQRSKKNKDTVFVAAEHEGASAFAEIHADRRKTARTLLALGGLYLRGKFAKGRGKGRARKNVERQRKQIAKKACR